jgi:hypothetical protein
MFLKRVLDRLLYRQFFRPEPAQSLSLFRFLYCMAVAAFLVSRAARHQAMPGSIEWVPIPLFNYLQIPLMSAEWLAALRWILITALTMTALGCFTRTSATISWIAYVIYMGTILGFCRMPHGKWTPHDMNIVVMVLVIMSVAPGTAVWGIDGLRKRGWQWRLNDPAQTMVSAWPAQLIKVTLALAYFGAGYCKVINDPLWADGYTVQSFLLHKYLLYDIQLSWFLAHYYGVCLLVGIMTLLLELTFFLVIFYPRLTWPFVITGLSFHLGILLTMNINFIIPFGLIYLIFLDWPTIQRLRSFARRLWPALDHEPAAAESYPAVIQERPRTLTVGDTYWARGCVFGVTGMLLACIFWRVESWPFTDYHVYQHRSNYARTSAYRVAAVDHQGQRQWVREWQPTEDPAMYRNIRFGKIHRMKGEAGLMPMLQHIARHAPAEWRSCYTKLMIVRRTFAGPAVPEGEFQVIDTPLVEVSLTETED